MDFVVDPRYEEFRRDHDEPARRRKIQRAMIRNRYMQGGKIVLSNPFVLGKAVRTLIKSIMGGYPLRSLEVAVGYECNFSCVQCSCALNRDNSRKRLTIPEFKDVIDQAIEMGAFQFNLNGGEPLIYYDEVLELCRYIRGKGRYVHMATNGFFLTEGRLKELKYAGLSSFEMGIDASTDAAHDRNRGDGSFRKIMENTRIAQRLAVRVAYNTVGSKDRIANGDLINTVYVAQKMGVMLMITPPCVTGHWAGRLDVLLTEEERWYIKWILSRYPHTRIDNYNGLRRLACPAAREKMALNPYGDVVSCPLIQIVYGNVRESKLRDIQASMLEDHYYFMDHSDGCPPSSDMNFIQDRLVNNRDVISKTKRSLP